MDSGGLFRPYIKAFTGRNKVQSQLKARRGDVSARRNHAGSSVMMRVEDNDNIKSIEKIDDMKKES
jgi:hypothetical protein